MKINYFIIREFTVFTKCQSRYNRRSNCETWVDNLEIWTFVDKWCFQLENAWKGPPCREAQALCDVISIYIYNPTTICTIVNWPCNSYWQVNNDTCETDEPRVVCYLLKEHKRYEYDVVHATFNQFNKSRTISPIPSVLKTQSGSTSQLVQVQIHHERTILIWKHHSITIEMLLTNVTEFWDIR